MSKSPIRIITDSAACLQRDFCARHGIEMVSLSLALKGQVYEEGFPDTYADFYARMIREDEIPRSSQPSVAAFAGAFERARNDGYEVVAPMLTSGVSGTYQSACMAAEMVDPEAITVIDTRFGGSAMYFFIEAALEAIEQGKQRAEVVARILSAMKRTTYDMTVSTLDYLKRGGRLSNVQAFFGSILNLRPHIRLRDGALVALNRLRGQAKVIDAIIADIPAHASKISVCHVLAADLANAVSERLAKLFPKALVRTDEMGPVIGCNLGPGALGIAYIEAENG